MSYVTKFDDTFWVEFDGISSWSGSAWVAPMVDGDYSQLKAIGSWATSYRPTSVRLTLSVSSAVNVEVSVKDASGGDLATPTIIALTTTPTQFEFPLTFAADDVLKLILNTGAGITTGTPASWTLTWGNIEFDSPAPPSAFWQDNVKCTETDA